MKRLTSSSGLIAAIVLSGLLAAACASGKAGSLGSGPTAASLSPSTPATSPAPGQSASATPPQARLFTFQIWLTRGGKLFETKRTEPFNVAVGKLALEALLKGPTDAERAAGVVSDLPDASTGVDEKLQITALSGGLATVEASPPLPNDFLVPKAQVVYTLTQYPNIRKVQFVGDRRIYTRASLDAELPAITVDSPSIGQQVFSPVRVSGTANVFEGTVNVRILDSNGHELARTFTTATCGSGCRGDYSVSIKYQVDHQQSGTVEVLDYSARDGSPENVVDIPVILSPSNDPASPAIVVSSPKPGATISSPVTVSGTADVFEAQFRIRILDESGHVLADVPVHASCGTGCRGTFSVKVSFHVSHRQRGSIWAFDYSPKDGSMIDLVKIPVTLTP
jgi:hypothetical protein